MMKNLKQWQIENDAEFEKEFPDAMQNKCLYYNFNPDKVKDFLHSSQESLKKVMVEEMRRKWNELSDLRDGTKKGDGEFIDAFDDYLLITFNYMNNEKEQVYNEYSSGKSIPDNEKLREEWNKEFGNPPLMIEELTEHMGRCALCGIKADAIADWWLSKQDETLSLILNSLKEEIDEKFRRFKEDDLYYEEDLKSDISTLLSETIKALNKLKE